MAPERIDDVTALLVRTAEAHGRYEESELGGVYDREWARWYSAYAVEHGIGDLVGHAVSAERLARFLADTFADFQRIEPEPTGGWPGYTSRRIVAEL
jgi:hypothetical protein